LSKLAWSWATQYPAVAFTNPFDVSTGEYGDKNFDAEWYWAAAELYLSTGEKQYKEYLEQHPPRHFSAKGSWTGYMEMLGVMSLLRNPGDVSATIYNPLKAATILLADSLTRVSAVNPYNQAISDFNWGSNSDVLNAAMSVAAAYQLEPKPEYLEMIRSSVDYVLGRNATGYSFVTGYGDRSPMYIHHRQSAADSIDQPVPGFLSGGPNSRQQDKEFATYPVGVAPMQSWVDQEGSYARNEICLNWNAPLIYVLGWLEARE
jgi:endoglucanase